MGRGRENDQLVSPQPEDQKSVLSWEDMLWMSKCRTFPLGDGEVDRYIEGMVIKLVERDMADEPNFEFPLAA
ncbi:hypothetical protein A3A64_02290 [Candidatus Gottesmanbacteria bacterium RIFCSPLOWO2_01_FULL_48_11]|uniref:Uncharacterized protein n=2 Tax=Candidatus Gottesmaniibacteriota TaxID=1752720 RepID=A0A0G1TYV6_9BACT|nr:MAG: hypothetical protein UY16_C0042G0009 [Candidatus Gottesmanbacteria bacterium GW2011_GWA2_47_9]OGG27609.1 MAG: hypothetical protein A3A64_02290 [Candidatus Gottesmanbacteria bacterium RIFCSPLOWO2_01_FULL_48_11]